MLVRAPDIRSRRQHTAEAPANDGLPTRPSRGATTLREFQDSGVRHPVGLDIDLAVGCGPVGSHPCGWQSSVEGDVIKALLSADLLDRLYLMIFPEIVGGGQRLFSDGLPGSKWKLAHQETGDLGEIALVHDREC
ncbi:dihydrofolate reductase family protein [Kitasatospora sp. NPDC048239]|uniref:dihydrofolate reductase family protein n=1 Tax=Kitasatospora sp. NPDC048239 TaxID=3364046 RepID=UPI003713BC98